MKPREVVALLGDIARDFAGATDRLGVVLDRIDSKLCRECRFPFKGEQPCEEGACSDCCARLSHTHIEQ